ncbi:hypothetical protein HY484_02715 [Candidatus Woesearchaeota archaeon]|nr:hypothetical protein [Candidatus Woesearchaeota archaeon]
MQQESAEFQRGFIEAYRGQKPWHSKKENFNERFCPILLSFDYLQGYAQGFNAYLARTGRQIIGKNCFILGYTDYLQKRQPALQQQDYLEGYTLASSDATDKKEKTLDEYFYIERDVLLFKFANNC